MKTIWGCETPTQFAVWQDEESEFFNCPLKFVPDTVMDWFYEYEYYQLFSGSAPAFAKQSAKFYDAARLYKLTMAELAPKQKQDNGDDLKILKEGFDARSGN